MNVSFEIDFRFADYSVRKVTIPDVNASGESAANFKVKLLALNSDISPLNGLLVGKDGSSAISGIDAARAIVQHITPVWTKSGGLLNG